MTPRKTIVLHLAQYLNRHTSWLKGIKDALGVQRLATTLFAHSARPEEIERIKRTAKTDLVTRKLQTLRNQGITNPVVYILAAESMGDVLSAEPIGRHIKSLYPDCLINWIVRTPFAEVIENAPFIEHTIYVDSLSEGYNILLSKAQAPHAVTINCHMDGTSCGKTKKIIRNNANPNVNFFTYYHIGTLLNAFSLAAGLPMLDEASEFHFKKGISSPLNISSPYVVLHCRSTDPGRDWTDEKWNLLAKHLLASGLTVVEIGMPKTIVSDSSHYIDFCGRKSLQQIAKIIQAARLFIGIDSGFAHVACAVKTPSVILLGRYAHYDSYMPYSGTFANSSLFKICRAELHHAAADVPESKALNTARALLSTSQELSHRQPESTDVLLKSIR